jgi:hypothetical protein
MERDRSLPLPDLMLSALQVNIAAGRLPPPEDDGRNYLKIPLNAFNVLPASPHWRVRSRGA